MKQRNQKFIPVCIFVFAILSILYSASGFEAYSGSNDICGNDIGNGHVIIKGPTSTTSFDNDRVFNSLQIDPLDANIVFIGTERNGLFKSIDGGMNWQWIRRGLKHTHVGYSEFYNVAVSPGGHMKAVVAATTNGPEPLTGPYATGAGIYKMEAGDSTWRSSNCGLPHANVVSVTFDPNNEKVLLAALGAQEPSKLELIGQDYAGGIYKSTNNGANWYQTVMPAGSEDNEFHQIYGRGKRTTVFFTFGFNVHYPNLNIGFLKSIDSGKTWTPFGPFGAGSDIKYFDVSTDGSVFYAYEYSDIKKKIHKSTNGGKTWTSFTGPFMGTVKVSPVNSNLVLFAGYALSNGWSNRLYRSIDGMNSYTPVLAPKNRIEDIEFAPSNSNIVYSVTMRYDVFKSVDGGKTWRFLIDLRNDIINQMNQGALIASNRQYLSAEDR